MDRRRSAWGMLRSASVATGMGLGALAACAHGTDFGGDVQASAGP